MANLLFHAQNRSSINAPVPSRITVSLSFRRMGHTISQVLSLTLASDVDLRINYIFWVTGSGTTATYNMIIPAGSTEVSSVIGYPDDSVGLGGRITSVIQITPSIHTYTFAPKKSLTFTPGILPVREEAGISYSLATLEVSPSMDYNSLHKTLSVSVKYTYPGEMAEAFKDFRVEEGISPASVEIAGTYLVSKITGIVPAKSEEYDFNYR